MSKNANLGGFLEKELLRKGARHGTGLSYRS